MGKITRQGISSESSVLIDIIRLAAALTVLVIHAHDQWFAQPSLEGQSGNDAHLSVIVFFALSGYVIAYTTSSNNRGPAQYALARLSRLYSVLAPALLLTAAAELLVWSINPDLHSLYSRGLSWPRYLLSLFFLNEVWFLHAAPPINGPLWSLGFEFWYYLLAGLWIYRAKSKWALPLLVSAAAIAGPKILSLMPVWLFGYWAFQLKSLVLPANIHWLIMGLLLGAVIVLSKTFPVLPFELGMPPMAFAGGFLKDWLTGFVFAVSLWFLPSARQSTQVSLLVQRFRKIADLTFSIYLLHYPLLIAWRGLILFKAGDTFQFWTAVVSVLVLSAAIGLFLERNKKKWTYLLQVVIKRIQLKNLSAKIAVKSTAKAPDGFITH